MRFIDRFTRDEFSAKVWWPFTMVLLVLFVLTFPAEHRAVDARHRETAVVDAALTRRVILPSVPPSASSSITGPLGDVLTEKVNDEILVNDPRIGAVRIWSPQHVLLWSDPHGALDSAQWLNDDDIDAATAAAGAPTWLVAHRTPTNEPGPATFYSYTAFGSYAGFGAQPLIASFEYRDGPLTSDVRASWLGYQIAIGLGMLLAFGLSLLSMREPLAEIGTGVPFFPGSVPEDLTLMEVDRAVAIEQAGDRIKERTASLQHKLEASEAARLRAEGRLQQALAALAQPGRRSRMPVPKPTPVAQQVVKVPRSEPIVAQPEPEPIVAQPEPEPEAVVVARVQRVPGPQGRSLVPKKDRVSRRTSKRRPVAAPAPKPISPKPVVEAPQPEPVVEAPEPAPQRPVVEKPKPALQRPVVETPEPAPQRPVVETPQPEPAPIVPPPEPAPIVPPPDPIITPEPDPVEVAKVEPSDDGGSPEVVVVPELQPVGTPAGPESASDLLDRLVEPVPEHGSTEAPRDLRAKLARTAALKKPGSKERREADEQHRS